MWGKFLWNGKITNDNEDINNNNEGKDQAETACSTQGRHGDGFSVSEPQFAVAS